jgi:hypothetical protein
VKKGEKFLDIFENMHFWGTPKIKKFLIMSIKVYEDENAKYKCLASLDSPFIVDNK